MTGGPAAVGPLLGGRPLVWLALQGLALTACASTAALALTVRPRTVVPVGARVRLTVLLCSGAVFTLWAWSWSLLRF